MAGEVEIFSGKIFRLTTELIGEELQYERVYQRWGVTVFPVTDEGKVRLLRKATADNSQPRMRPVSGYIEDGEDALSCAKRELSEEAELEAEEWTLFTYTEGEGGLKKRQCFFVAKALRPCKRPAHADDNETILGHVDLGTDELKQRTLAGEFGTMTNAFALLKLIEEWPGLAK
jgi:8-oxo-dGTP pyrophosphatase MutT (NUDIX family)